MVRLTLIVVALAVVGSALSHKGVAHCSPSGELYPVGCGTFWWLLLAAAVFAAEAYRTYQRTFKKDKS